MGKGDSFRKQVQNDRRFYIYVLDHVRQRWAFIKLAVIRGRDRDDDQAMGI
jgi:hypothetical protein